MSECANASVHPSLAARAVRSLHTHRCAHGSIAAQNAIKIGNRGLKLANFGRCIDLSAEPPPAVVFSAHDDMVRHRAPEQSTSPYSATQKADVWAFALTVCQLFNAGQLPYDGGEWQPTG